MIHARTTALAGALVLALGTTAIALAERGEDSFWRPPSFSFLDIDRDGVLSRGEVQGYTPMYGVFDQVDANNNDVLEPAEFAAYEVDPGIGGPANPRGREYIERDALK